MQNETSWKVNKGLPKGSKLHGCTIDPYTNMIFLFVEHESFEEIDIGTVAPTLDTEFKRL